MASIRTIKGNKYSRVRWWVGYGCYKEKTISLSTKDDAVADYRNRIVTKKEYLIKQGVEYEFEWENNDGENKQIVYTLIEAVEEYLEYLERYGRKANTIRSRRESYNSFMKCIGKTFPVQRLDVNTINKFIDNRKGKLNDNGINMKLGHIRGLLNHLHFEKEVLNKAIKVKKIKADPKEPSYLNQANIEEIMALDWLDDHYKNVFRFYWETGCRLREPYTSYIKNGDWLIITKTKNGRVKKVKLQPHHIPIVNEIYAKLEQCNTSHKIFGDYYGRMFKKVARAINRGELHFHNLRDTYAVIRYYETRDIYAVSNELCHSSVTTTEKYANFFSFNELKDDFPKLVEGNSIYSLADGSKKHTKLRDGNPRMAKSYIPLHGGVNSLHG